MSLTSKQTEDMLRELAQELLMNASKDSHKRRIERVAKKYGITATELRKH